jgi:hypothetical protein
MQLPVFSQLPYHLLGVTRSRSVVQQNCRNTIEANTVKDNL